MDLQIAMNGFTIIIYYYYDYYYPFIISTAGRQCINNVMKQ